jgi:hypothetical protein
MTSTDKARAAMEKAQNGLLGEIQGALGLTQLGQEQWVDGTIKLAEAMYAARQMHHSDRAFGEWLEDNEVDLSRDDRAALINLGRHSNITINEILGAETFSWRTLWQQHVRPKVPEDSQSAKPARGRKPGTGRQPAPSVVSAPPTLAGPVIGVEAEPADPKRADLATCWGLIDIAITDLLAQDVAPEEIIARVTNLVRSEKQPTTH